MDLICISRTFVVACIWHGLPHCISCLNEVFKDQAFCKDEVKYAIVNPDYFTFV
jgi:hypothetical protein